MYEDVLVLGGAGLVGLQVCRRISTELRPTRIVVASLLEAEARAACDRLAEEFGAEPRFVPAWGNLFVPASMAHLPRGQVMSDPAMRKELMEFLYGDFEAALPKNHLVQLIGT